MMVAWSTVDGRWSMVDGRWSRRFAGRSLRSQFRRMGWVVIMRVAERSNKAASFGRIGKNLPSGSSSVVEHLLPKQRVASSSLVSRSSFPNDVRGATIRAHWDLTGSNPSSSELLTRDWSGACYARCSPRPMRSRSSSRNHRMRWMRRWRSLAGALVLAVAALGAPALTASAASSFTCMGGSVPPERTLR